MLAIAQTRIGHDPVEKEDERGATGVGVIERADKDCTRDSGGGKRGLQTLLERVTNIDNCISAHAALLVLVRSISIGGMPSLASSARVACAMCSRLIWSPAAAAMNAARSVICRICPPVRSIRRAS